MNDNNNFIKKYWENQAKTHKDSYWVSWGDIYMIKLEQETIGEYINSGHSVLDVGCGNGYSSFELLKKKPKSIIGIDFAENMIIEANNKLTDLNINNISFEVGDIRKLRFEDNTFDIVYTTRVLINLPNWEEQKIGIKECIRVTKEGGLIILSEAFWEPLSLLNSLRALKGLKALVEHDFNRYLKKDKLNNFLNSLNLKFKNLDFSSIYYLGSRFLREIVTDFESYPGYSNPINKIFYDIEKKYSGGDFGIQQAYVIKK